MWKSFALLCVLLAVSSGCTVVFESEGPTKFEGALTDSGNAPTVYRLAAVHPLRLPPCDALANPTQLTLNPLPQRTLARSDLVD